MRYYSTQRPVAPGNYPKDGYVLQLDIKHYFPNGQWERMTQEEKADWTKKFRSMQERRKKQRA